jgi:hypothetical protein
MSNGTSNGTNGEIRIGTSTVKIGLAQMLKGGVIVSSGRMVCWEWSCTIALYCTVLRRVTSGTTNPWDG